MSLLRLSGGCSTKEEKPTGDGSKEENISHLRSPDKAASNLALRRTDFLQPESYSTHVKL